MKVYIDFEYNSTREEKLNVVCCSLQVEGGQLENYWLHDGSNRLSFLGRIEDLKDYTFVAYNVVAEAGAFLSLGLNPLDYKWIDLYLEYRQLLNHNHKLMYGKQLIQGRKKTTKPPPANKWDITEDQKKILDMSKPEFNLASACYKLLEVEIDTVFKNDTRQLIISAPKRFTDEQRATILEYCASDIKYLPELLKAMVREYRELFRREPELLSSLKAEMLLRAEYSCRTAIIERKGYPIDLEATRAFSDSVPSLLFELQTEINLLFPTIRPFELDKKYNYTWKQERTREWVRTHIKRTGASWRQTDKGSLSLSLDAFKDHFNYSHNYPKDNFGAQMVRYLSFKQQLNGFSPTSKNSFWDYVGSDDRARAYFGIYGSQSSRSQPKATGFLFLKSAWMRALCVPPRGRMMIGIDFGSQEFLLGALISGDDNMRKAYESGDPYLYFAKLAGAVPWDGTKEEYKVQRNLFKSTVLGLSYKMGYRLLAQKLTEDMGHTISEFQAEKLLNQFNRAFPKYAKYGPLSLAEYNKRGFLKIPCGWSLLGDNKNDKSIQNFPIQGFGASIMRKAVQLAQDKGLDIVLTLHDALYAECDLGDFKAVQTLAECMDEAFRFYFPDHVKPLATVRLEADVWSPELEDGYKTLTYANKYELPTVVKSIYIDPRAKVEYEKFSKYFKPIDHTGIEI